MPGKLPPIPTGVPPGHSYWNDWYEKLRYKINNTVTTWGDVDFSGSNLTDIVTRNHNDLQNTQGGAANEKYHLTAAEHTTIGTLASGTYTPTLTAIANVSATTAYACQYMRVGSVVTVSGVLAADPTAATTNTEVGITIPIASDFANSENCAGTAFCPVVSGQGAAIQADVTNNRAIMRWLSSDTSNRDMYFTFTYRII